MPSAATVMRLHYWRSPHKNFADELNVWLWPKVFPEIEWNDASDLVFVGIGTILNTQIPNGRQHIIFGAGAGYGSIPNILQQHWQVYFVRGPLTAKIAGLDPAIGYTDPAILVADFAPKSPIERRGTIFVPHWQSFNTDVWRYACQSVGVDYVDPCQQVDYMIRRISSAAKVIAESMHAAIIADALRVPWVPVALSHEISAFKWCDFTFSLGLPYEPYFLPPSGVADRLRSAVGGLAFRRLLLPMQREQKAGSVLFTDPDRQIEAWRKITRRNASKGRLPGRVLESMELGLRPIMRRLDTFTLRQRIDLASRNLTELADLSGFMSTDKAHNIARTKIRAAVSRLRREHGIKTYVEGPSNC